MINSLINYVSSYFVSGNKPTKEKPLVKIFSDFDGTFVTDYNSKSYLSHLDHLEKFKAKSGESINLMITTARPESNIDELLYSVNDLSIIDQVTTFNGGFTYATDFDKETLYFDSKELNKKEDLIRESSNWEDEVALDLIKDIMQEYSPKGGNFAFDKRSNRIILSFRNQQDRNKMAKLIQQKFDNAGINIKLSFNKLYDAQSIYKKYIAYYNPNYNIEDYNKLFIMPVNIEDNYDPEEMDYRYTLQVIPDICDFMSNKHLAVLAQVEQAKKDGTFVIAMGNDYNDSKMLNIFTYILPAGIEVPTRIEDAWKVLYSDSSFVQKIKDLPLKLILIGDDLKRSSPEEYKMFEQLSYKFPDKLQMVPYYSNVKHDYITDTFAFSILNYAKDNSEFNKKLQDSKAVSFYEHLKSIQNTASDLL